MSKQKIKDRILDVVLGEIMRLGIGDPHKSFNNGQYWETPLENEFTYTGGLQIGDLVKVKWKPLYGLIVNDGKIYYPRYEIGGRTEKSFLVKINDWSKPIEIGSTSLMLAVNSKAK